MTDPTIHRFDPTRGGWVVRVTSRAPSGREVTTWWYGPDHGFGTTSGPLDYSVAVWETKKAATDALRSVYGTRHGRKVERVKDAVGFAVTECDRHAAEVLAGDRKDKYEIAAANDRRKAYLQGRRRSPR